MPVVDALLTLGALIDPGTGSAPPNASDGITDVVSWGAWLALAACVLGVIISGGLMAVQSRRGEGGEHMGRLAFALGGAIVVGSASALVGAFI